MKNLRAQLHPGGDDGGREPSGRYETTVTTRTGRDSHVPEGGARNSETGNGKKEVSPDLPAKVQQHLANNSPTSTGTTEYLNQVNEINTFFNEEIRKAVTENRRADEKYLKKEKDSFNKKYRIVGQAPAEPGGPPRKKQGNDSRNDGGGAH